VSYDRKSFIRLFEENSLPERILLSKNSSRQVADLHSYHVLNIQLGWSVNLSDRLTI
jgi:hypothetical protein